MNVRRFLVLILLASLVMTSGPGIAHGRAARPPAPVTSAGSVRGLGLAGGPGPALPAGVSAEWWAAVPEDIRPSEYRATWQKRAYRPAPLAGLDASPNWTAASGQPNAYFGVSVSTAGDVNGDGYADVIVGAYGYDGGQANEGRVYVYHGSATGLSTTANWTAESDQLNAYFGNAVGTAGDVNHDGYDDVIVGAYLYDDGQTNEGRAYVYYGSATGLSTTADWVAESDQAYAFFGYAVGTAGDVNGDGYDDVIVSAPWYDGARTEGGRVYVYHGSATGLSTTADWVADSDQSAAGFGFSVSTAGDVNRDGYADIIVGTPWYDDGQTDEGRAFVYHGSSGGLTTGAANWTAESNQDNAYFGYSVSTAGDVNGDGYADVIAGAHYYDDGQTNEGRAYVYHGSATGLSTTANWMAESDQADAFFGRSVATAGDVNRDGYGDIVVGAVYYDDGQPDEGRAYVYHGSSSGLTAGPADWTVESDQANAYLGNSVGTAGDVNHDGYDDVVVGALHYDDTQPDEGRAYVYYYYGAADAPIAGLSAVNDSPTALGSTTTLTGSVAAGSNVAYAWAFGDGSTGSGAVVPHTYPAVGVYTAVVTASNSVSLLTATTAVTITDAIIAGLAATNDSPTVLGDTTALAATVTAGSNVAYAWAFGDGATGSGAGVTHTYPAVGVYMAVVTASNPVSALAATTTVTITEKEETPACPCSPDSYEEDDFASQAAGPGLGERQAHNFCNDATDWITFTARAGNVYTITTSSWGPRADTFLTLFDTDARTRLAANDDYEGATDYSSRIVWQAPADGVYYVRATNRAGLTGCSTDYELWIEQIDRFYLYLPVVMRSYDVSTAGKQGVGVYPTGVISHTCPDTYEPDDTWQQAPAIEPGVVQVHSFDSDPAQYAADKDFGRFSILSGTTVTFTVAQVTDTLTLLELHDSRGATLDVTGTNQLVWMATGTGRYYLSVSPLTTTYGCAETVGYSLVGEWLPLRAIYLPVVLRSYTTH